MTIVNINDQKTYKILCVCLGNICRSPTAEIILQTMAIKAQLSIFVDSAGTANYHLGEAPDKRSQAFALQHGYDMSQLRARQIQLDDFKKFDWILAMDQQNLKDLQRLQQRALQQFPTTQLAQLAMMTEHDQHYHQQPVPDPYYGDDSDFERVIDLCESSSRAWIKFLQQKQN